MKTKTLWKSIASVVLLLAMIMLVTVSCKKKDEETPPITPPPPEHAVGKLFTNLKGYTFLTPEEQANITMHYSGDFLFTYARGIHQNLTGGTLTEIPYFDIFAFAYDLLAEKKLDDSLAVNFRRIDADLAQIQHQLKWVLADLGALNFKLTLGIVDIEEMIQGYIAASITDNIENAWDSTTSNGMRWYSVNAKLAQQGNPNAVPFITLKNKISPDFINRYYGNPTIDLANNIKQIGQLVIGSTDPKDPLFSSSTLKTFIDKELLQSKFSYGDSTTAIYNYKCLEDFFMTMVNYQYQGLIALGNCIVGDDTTGTGGSHQELSQWYTGTFLPYMIAEIGVFNEAVNYLAANTYDYRNEARFKIDFENFDYGVTDDNITGPVYIRANLLNSLLLNALGQENQSVYFNANFPDSYMSSYIMLKTNGGALFAIKPTGSVNSQFYFTKWTSGTSISPDTKLNNFSCQFEPSGSFQANVYISPLVEVGMSYATSPAEGNIPIIYLDPTNIRSQSATPDATHTMPFGSGTVNWPWGYVKLTWETANIPWNHIPGITMNAERPNFTKTVGTPSFYSCNGSSWSEQTGRANQFFASNGEAWFSGPIPTTKDEFFIQDVIYINLTGVLDGETKLFSRIISDPADFSAGSFMYAKFTAIAGNSDVSHFYCYNEQDSYFSPITYDYVLDLSTTNAISFGYQLHISELTTSGNHELGTQFQTQPIYMGIAPIIP